MMAMMEKYQKNLEDIVEERTTMLIEEKKKTEALLLRMLPKSVCCNFKTVLRESFLNSFDVVYFHLKRKENKQYFHERKCSLQKYREKSLQHITILLYTV